MFSMERCFEFFCVCGIYVIFFPILCIEYERNLPSHYCFRNFPETRFLGNHWFHLQGSSLKKRSGEMLRKLCILLRMNFLNFEVAHVTFHYI